jgi:hypothetical protein
MLTGLGWFQPTPRSDVHSDNKRDEGIRCKIKTSGDDR